ncbi:VOC family protein [Cohnella mopanensis]|uniref:VOC family protein n=1 Tax=Cohnella mopanensis TaxID=2911966 RepID=UPI001EF90DCC|nr:VOC family protein [Cohnella mopanensis]
MTKNPSVPTLYFDGSFIDVLWDNHDAAVSWFQKHLGWDVQRQELWKPDPRCTHGKMTQMNWGTWLVSSLSNERLPHHYTERGTIDPNVRLCWRVRNLKELHRNYQNSGIRVTDIHSGPGLTHYFDFWATNEGIRLTAQEDSSVDSDGFFPSWNRIGVRDLDKSVEWYNHHLGMEVDADYREHGYVIMKLKLNHQPEGHSLWVLEQLSEEAASGKVDGPVRLSCWVKEREDFFNYHRYLINSRIDTSEIGGFLTRGMVSFHFYDLDGNRLNISSM